MPTNQNAYNSRVTDEALEKRFRDTFRSQGGAELIDDLYASGVIVPVVDFTQAAEGSQLPQNLQTAWDFTTDQNQVNNQTLNLVSTAGFYRVQGVLTATDLDSGAAVGVKAWIGITDGVSIKRIWGFSVGINTANAGGLTDTFDFNVFLRSGDTLQGFSNDDGYILDVATRQIATLSGDLVNPSGFTSS